MLQTCNYRILENASALASMCRLRNVLNVFPNAWDHIYIYICSWKSCRPCVANSSKKQRSAMHIVAPSCKALPFQKTHAMVLRCIKNLP